METVNLEKITLWGTWLRRRTVKMVSRGADSRERFCCCCCWVPLSWSKYLNFYSLTRAWNLDWLHSLSLGEMNPRVTQEEEIAAHVQIQESLSLILQKPLTPEMPLSSLPWESLVIFLLRIPQWVNESSTRLCCTYSHDLYSRNLFSFWEDKTIEKQYSYH